ncbi:hypothetical protein BA896_023175 [Janthinobacterium lividum]|uniref:KfrA N-terminal DNA-binding domain-containing protein n=1 Tax=Janthinobacterium lividum TaxID=29581 RepID=A0A1E8PPL4_9BURK|nr:hypothetical protein BA896_023175 [Janthinobacterium lividum]
MQPAANTKVTFEAVAAAAEALSVAGKRASVRNVMDALGGGSPNAVLPHLQAWKAGRPGVRVADVALDGRIITILGEQITSAVADATKAAEARAGDLEADLEAVADAGRLAETRAAELADELARCQGDQQQQAGRLDALTAELERLKLDAAAAVAEARTEAAREREAGEHVRQALVRAELRLEAVPGMEAALADLRGLLDVERMARVDAEKAAAVASAKLDGMTDRATRTEARIEQIEKQAAGVARELVSANAAVQAGQARLESAARELDDAKKTAADARSAAKKAGEEAAELRGQVQQSKVDALPASASPEPKPAKAPTKPKAK